MRTKSAFLKLALSLSLLSPLQAQPPLTEHLKSSSQNVPTQIEKIRETSSNWLLEAAPPATPELAPVFRGLAHWRADYEMSKIRPEWGLQRIRPYNFITSMWDACNNSHGIGEPELYAGEWNEYKKKNGVEVTQSLLDMIATFIGQEQLAESLDTFAATQAGKTSQLSEVWEGLPPFQGKSWAEIMEPWTQNATFPLVRVSLVPDSNKLRVRQMGFRLYPDSGAEPADRWLIPMALRYEDQDGTKTHPVLLETSHQVFELPSKGAVKWVYPNAGGTGFYRTVLSERTHEALLESGFEKLTAKEKLALVGNQWRLVRHGDASVALFLDLVERSSAAADDSMLALMLTEMDYLGSFELSPNDYEAWNKFVLKALRPLVRKSLSLEAKAPHQVKSQARLLRVAALAGDPAAKSALKFLAADPYLTGALSGPYKPVHAALSGDPKVELKLIQDLGRAIKGREGYDIVTALAHSRDIELLSQTIDTLVQRPDAVVDYAIWGLSAGSPEARRLGYQRLQKQWRNLPAFEGWLRAFSGGSQRHSLLRFAQAKRDKDALKVLAERNTGQFLTMNRVSGDIGDWLAEQGYGE